MREPGFYWVYYKPNRVLGVAVARWGTISGEDDGAWRFVGNDSTYGDLDIEVVSERLTHGLMRQRSL